MTDPKKEIDTRAFRNALGMFPTGVTVVTARTRDGDPVGITISSFNSVSLTPPLVLWSLGKQHALLPVFQGAEVYAINVLAEDQRHLSQLFASRDLDKFGQAPHSEGDAGVPLIEGCSAWFECCNTVCHDGGDHFIFVSEVVRFEQSQLPPLVFHGGRYRHLAAEE